MSQVHVIALAGLSCSGKSTTARILAAELDAPLLCLDDYYLALTDLSLEERHACNFDAPEMFDMPLLQEHLWQLLNGEAIQKPTYDFIEFTRAPGTEIVHARDYVIVEGQYAMFWPEINKLSRTRVFMDVSPLECLRRRILRDVQQRGRDEAEVRWRFHHHVLPMYDRYIHPSKENATLLLTGPPNSQRNAEIILESVLVRSGAELV